MRLSEQCKMCKNNWDGHCVMGNDRWKARMADTETECEEYEENDREEKEEGKKKEDEYEEEY